MIQHTIYCKPGSVLDTQWGILPYRDWLDREAERIKSKGGVAEVRKAPTTHVFALFVEEDPRNTIYDEGIPPD